MKNGGHREINKAQANKQTLYHGVMVGEVINTDDPRQEGRLQVFVSALDYAPTDDLPWCVYCSPFGGVTQDLERGRESEKSAGPIAYGMWAIPKVGARVFVMCINGTPQSRIWIGTIPTMFANHTMPHGRYMDEPKGPLTSVESPTEPLYSTQFRRFTNEFATEQGFESREYQTRGRDNQVSALDDDEIGTRSLYSKTADSEDVGYGTNRTTHTGKESNVYSFTTPGFHSWSMDDNAKSCRMVLRTTTGHQIILDDTNERVIITTAEGKTWIELDEKGTIDIYSEADVSVRSKTDINLTADKTVRIAGKDGIHLVTQGEIRMHSGLDTHIRADENIRMHSGQDYFTEASGEIHTYAGGNIRIKGSILYFESDTNHIQSTTTQIGGAVNIDGAVGITGALAASGRISSVVDVVTSTHSLNLHSHTYVLPKIPASLPQQPGITTPQLFPTGSAIPAAAAPEQSDTLPSETTMAFFPTRVPQHEPYARVWLDINQTDVNDGTLIIFDAITIDPDSVSEFSYNDESVGRGSPSRGITFERNSNWRR